MAGEAPSADRDVVAMLGRLLANQRAAMRRGDFAALTRLAGEAARQAETLGEHVAERAVATRLLALCEETQSLLTTARAAAKAPSTAYDEKGGAISVALTTRQGKQL